MNSVILGNLEEYGVLLRNATERNNVILIMMRLSWMRKSGVYSGWVWSRGSAVFLYFPIFGSVKKS